MRLVPTLITMRISESESVFPNTMLSDRRSDSLFERATPESRISCSKKRISSPNSLVGQGNETSRHCSTFRSRPKSPSPRTINGLRRHLLFQAFKADYRCSRNHRRPPLFSNSATTFRKPKVLKVGSGPRRFWPESPEPLLSLALHAE